MCGIFRKKWLQIGEKGEELTFDNGNDNDGVDNDDDDGDEVVYYGGDGVKLKS